MGSKFDLFDDGEADPDDEPAGETAPASSPRAAAPANSDFSLFDEPQHNVAPPPAPAAEPPKPSFLRRAASAVAQPFVDAGRGIYEANKKLSNAIVHPIDAFHSLTSDPGASLREGMRGVNSNIPFANRAVEALGGPPAQSPEDEAASPLAGTLGSLAGLPAATMVGGIAAKAVGAAAPVVSKAIKGVGDAARESQIERTAARLETKVNKGTRAGLRSDAVADAIVDSPELRRAAGDDAKVAKITDKMQRDANAKLQPIYNGAGPADEAVAKAVANVDDRIARLAAGDANEAAAARKLQAIRDEFNDRLGGRETTTPQALRAEQSAYQKNGYAKNINQDPDVSAAILAQREMSKAVGDSLIEHVTGMDYNAARIAAAKNPDSLAGRLFRANNDISAANKIDAGIADRAGRAAPKHGLLKTAEEIKNHGLISYGLSKFPAAADAAGNAVVDQVAKLGVPSLPGAPGVPPIVANTAQVGANLAPTHAAPTANPAAVALLVRLARAGVGRKQLQMQAAQAGVPVEIADNIAQENGL